MTSYLDGLPTHSYVTGAVIASLALVFIIWFVVPALRLSSRLGRILRDLARPDLQGPVDLESVFAGKGVLAHLWSEFRETLHEERVLDARTGQFEIVRLRATQPSEAFFTEATVVDTAVRTEFFKHLPGILTGIGIIGTFLGLIVGLKNFQVTSDTTAVQQSLEALLQSVSKAFLVSLLAIALAMVVTALEKLLLVRLYAKAEKLTQAIDEHYKAGVGEEYLSRLVSASEESASQSRVLKDALVEDLKQLLVEVVDRQIQAQATSNAQLGQSLAKSFSDELGGPLDKIAHAVGQVSRDQGSAVQSLLTDVLASFSARMESMFGSQLSGISDMQQQTVSALQAAVQQLESLSTSMASAGQSATEMMAAQVAEAMRKLEARQAVMNDQMRNFLQEVKETVSQSQSQSAEHMTKLLGDLSASAGALVGSLSAQSQAHVAAMGSQVGGMTEAVAGATQQVAAAVERLEKVTVDAITRMNSGAETLAIAADDFAKAGAGVTGVLVKSETLVQQLNQAAGSVGQAAKSLDGMLADYRSTREAVQRMLEAIQGSVEAARKEASITSDVLARLEGAASRLSAAQKAADEYLGNVTRVLEEAHQAFADNIKRTLGDGNRAFYDSLTLATKLLKEAIAELEVTLGSFNPSRR